MNKMGPLVSVLTPTWNRASYLERVWQGLRSQTYRHFEWIVADDGSQDDTCDRVRSFRERSEFLVVLVTADLHVGKARMDNEAVRAARGDLIIWNDSDDFLLPNCLDRLVATWLEIPARERPSYVAVSALCATDDGRTLNELIHSKIYDSTWNDMAEKEHIRGDMLHLIDASALKQRPFPEVDFVIPESVVWSSLGHLRVRVLPEILKIVEYRAPHAISFGNTQQYCRGRAHALAASEAATRGYRRSWKTRVWRLVTFVRYSMHGEITAADQLKLWRGNGSMGLWILAYPFSWLLAAKDRAQGKVRYTHREFAEAALRATIRIYR